MEFLYTIQNCGLDVIAIHDSIERCELYFASFYKKGALCYIEKIAENKIRYAYENREFLITAVRVEVRQNLMIGSRY